jgi:hypothetical protein
MFTLNHTCKPQFIIVLVVKDYLEKFDEKF